MRLESRQWSPSARKLSTRAVRHIVRNHACQGSSSGWFVGRVMSLAFSLFPIARMPIRGSCRHERLSSNQPFHTRLSF